MAEGKVRLGFIGLGNWGNRLASAAERSGAAEIVRCFARTEETRAAFAEKFACRPAASLDELLGDDKVEGVAVSTPTPPTRTSSAGPPRPENTCSSKNRSR